MESPQRKSLKQYKYTQAIFIATVQSYDKITKHLILSDIEVKDNEQLKFVAHHIHIRNEDISLELQKGQLIIFSAFSTTYIKNSRNGKYKNYSLCNLSNIRVIGELYYG